MKIWTTRILLTFVIFSLGFGVGKEFGLRNQASSSQTVGEEDRTAASGKSKVMVYYMHTTFRCVTCNTIERMAKNVVETSFADAMVSKHIQWREINFQEREDLAKKYDIASSCVVVVKMENGQETGFQRLDEVWTLSDQPTAFADYLSEAIRKYLDELTER